VGTINFKHGALIRGGPKLQSGGKWDAMLDDSVRNAHTNADLTIFIRVHFQRINPAHGQAGTYADSNDKPGHPSKKKIQRWAPGEFETFVRHLLHEAQHFWTGVFWLKTPSTYQGLDWPDDKPTHRCHLYCRLDLSEAKNPFDAHYTIAVVRVQDSETFRSASRLYSQRDIQAENLIPHSTTKFWTHYHEVGHLLGLGHVNHHDLHTAGLNEDAAYGVTLQQMQDVMGKGSVRHPWHAGPWQEAAAALTGTTKEKWEVHMEHHHHHLRPTPL
jgi:hypothetical protein